MAVFTWQQRAALAIEEYMAPYCRAPDAYYHAREISAEIAKRVAMNAAIVGETREALLPQILIVLADYREHAWTHTCFQKESARRVVADGLFRILSEAPQPNV